MPICSISRRAFLRTTLTASAALLAPKLPKSWSAAAEPDPHSWVLLSDPHIAADQSLVHSGVNMAENLRTVTGEISKLSRPPAGILVNGDCAFRTGEPGDYEAFAGLIQPLRALDSSLVLTRGNHDERVHFRTAFPKADPPGRPLADRHVLFLPGARANWIFLDSLDRTNSTPGLLGPDQLAWLTQTLDAHADRPAIVVGHHNLEKAPVRSGLLDSDRLLEIIEPRRQVKAYIFGHTHHWNHETTDRGIHLINLPPVAYLFQKGDPNGWVHLALQSEGLRFQLHALDPNHPAQGQMLELPWRTGQS